MVVASYLNDDPRRLDSLLCLLHSFKAQTWPHWEAIVIHDGPIKNPTAKAKIEQVDKFGKGVIWLIETEERKGQFGHPYRHLGIRHAPGHYIGLSNDDNYYAPVYFEWMLSEIQAVDAQLAYCDMIHSHRQWQVIKAQPKRGFIDAGNWLVSANIAKTTPWTDMGFSGDWTYFKALHAKAKRVVRVPAPLFVHN